MSAPHRPGERAVDKRLADLLELLRLEPLEVNLFRGESRDIGSPQVFGGQVLGQALMAASETVGPERLVHSLHAYFLRRGDFNAPNSGLLFVVPLAQVLGLHPHWTQPRE